MTLIFLYLKIIVSKIVNVIYITHYTLSTSMFEINCILIDAHFYFKTQKKKT